MERERERGGRDRERAGRRERVELKAIWGCVDVARIYQASLALPVSLTLIGTTRTHTAFFTRIHTHTHTHTHTPDILPW